MHGSTRGEVAGQQRKDDMSGSPSDRREPWARRASPTQGPFSLPCVKSLGRMAPGMVVEKPFAIYFAVRGSWSCDRDEENKNPVGELDRCPVLRFPTRAD